MDGFLEIYITGTFYCQLDDRPKTPVSIPSRAQHRACKCMAFASSSLTGLILTSHQLRRMTLKPQITTETLALLCGLASDLSSSSFFSHSFSAIIVKLSNENWYTYNQLGSLKYLNWLILGPRTRTYRTSRHWSAQSKFCRRL